MHVGMHIKSARLEMGLSQAQLAELTNVSQPTIANWENGSHAPRHAALSKIANALNSTPALLLDTPAASDASPLPYHHIPILEWPQTSADVDSAPVIGYMTASCDAARPFALIAPRDFADFNISEGETMVFDRAQTLPDANAACLCNADGGMTLSRRGPNKKGAPVTARLIMAVSKF